MDDLTTPVLDIIVPFSTKADPEALALCIRGIYLSTSGDFRVTLVPTEAGANEKHVEAIRRIVGSSPGVDWRMVDYSGDGPTARVMAAIVDARGQYIAVVPPTHALDDANWFVKLQVPFMRTPHCGLAFASDSPELAGTGAQPFPWDARGGAPGRVVISPRDVIRAIASVSRQFDYPEALVWGAKGLGLVTWSIPGVRIDVAGAEAPRARQEPRNAYRPGR